MTNAGDLLVRGGDIISVAGVANRGDVLIRAGTIERVDNSISAPGTPELNATGCYVVPGLINAHYHSAENFNPGLYENLPLDLWYIHSHQVTRTQPPSRDAIYARTMLGAAQMLRNGITCVVDFLFEAPEISVESLEPVVQAYRDAGMRATILLGVTDKTFADSLPLTDEERAAWSDEAEAPSVDRIMSVATEAVERWHQPGGLIGIGMGPSAPQRCSDELMQRSLELCRSRGLAWQTHVLETKTQAMTAHDWHRGSSFVEVMTESGQLDQGTTLVHTVWLSRRDIELIAERGAGVVHCPVSNLRLGDGVAPVPSLLRAGIPVALGTDGRGCDEQLDVLELARLTALMGKARGEGHHDWISAVDGFRMATANASVPAGHGEGLGRIAPGARGDLTIVRSDTTDLRSAPRSPEAARLRGQRPGHPRRRRRRRAGRPQRRPHPGRPLRNDRSRPQVRRGGVRRGAGGRQGRRAPRGPARRVDGADERRRGRHRFLHSLIAAGGENGARNGGTASAGEVLAAIFIAALNLRIAIAVVGPLIEEIRADTGMSSSVAGLLAAIPFACMSVFSFTGPPIVGRWGLKRVITGALVLVGGGCLLRAAMPDAALLIAATVPIGAGIALAGLSLPILVKQYFPRHPGAATGAYTTAIAVGIIGIGFSAVPLSDALGGWRGVIALTAVPALLGAVVWAATSLEQLAERPGRPRAQKPIGVGRRTRPDAAFSPDAPAAPSYSSGSSSPFRRSASRQWSAGALPFTRRPAGTATMPRSVSLRLGSCCSSLR